ncbi:acetyl-CoA carboxylase carboxyltransferase subunit alpha [Fusobacterium sp. PH5-44]|uniref:acetyl-CoA carboxylase carboxyltransferase subunit alpha n=1 Tax=unclassified Fusobacterium TaxID=2648384 RepID=UPI003D259CE7
MNFEKEIIEIDKKIEELKRFSEEKEIDLSIQIKKLEEEREEKIKEAYNNMSAWDIVKISRNPNRPYTLDYIEYMMTDFVELHGDRLYRDDPAIVGGLGKIDGKKVMIIGHQKGRTTDEKLLRNFGMANPEGYRKALRLSKMAERFNIPILFFIDTPGAYPGIEAEKHGQGEAIARNLMELSGIATPMISVVIGEGGSGGALGLGVTDRIFMMENSIYSVISPEGCAAILYKDSSRSAEAAENLRISAKSLYELKVIDGIIEEPSGGAHRSHKTSAENLKKVVLDTFEELKKLSKEELIEQRYDKFRNVGYYVGKEFSNH